MFFSIRDLAGTYPYYHYNVLCIIQGENDKCKQGIYLSIHADRLRYPFQISLVHTVQKVSTKCVKKTTKTSLKETDLT